MADSQRKTENLWDAEFEQGGINISGNPVTSSERIRAYKAVQPNTTYTFSSTKYVRLIYGYNDGEKVGIIYDVGFGLSQSVTFTTQSNCTRIGIVIAASTTATGNILPSGISDVMFNTGSTALPYEPYWQHSLRKLTTATEAVDTTVQPSEFTATWAGWHDVSVKEKSENLWDEEYTGISNTIKYKPVYVGDGTFTMSSTVGREGTSAVLYFLAGNVSTGAHNSTNSVYDGQNRTQTAIDGYVTVAYRSIDTLSPENHNTMLSKGSIALPYWS